MQAAWYEQYGQPNVLQLKEIPVPAPKEDEVLLQVYAASINSSDWEFLTGKPIYTRIWGLLKPKIHVLGSDVAGVIVKTGKNVKKFKAGDEVFGDLFNHWGGFAEYACAPENALTRKPENVTFTEAAALPQSSLIAWQALRRLDENLKDKKQVKGQKLLVNGAGGGGGTFALQLARLYGYEATGVDNRWKQKTMQAAGAEHVIDFRKTDCTKTAERYHFILDFVGHHSIGDYKKILTDNGRYVMVGGSAGNILNTLLCGKWLSKTTSKKFELLAHEANKGIESVLKLLAQKKIKPMIDRVFSLQEIQNAFQYFAEGKAGGKLVIQIKS